MDTAGGGGGTEGASSGPSAPAIAIDPSYLAPWTGHAPDRGVVPQWVAPSAFVAPDEKALLADPSYQFRVSQGEHVLENSAAARGTLNSGGTLQDILNYGQKAGSQEYGNVYDRAMGVWQQNWNNARTDYQSRSDASESAYNRAWKEYMDAKDTWYANQDKPFDKLFKSASLGATAAAS
jgi:hypothetical protein